MRTETLRMVSEGDKSELALSLAASAASAEVQLYVVDAERARIPGDELEPTDLLPTWHVLSGKSDYLARRSLLLDAKPSERHVVEAVGATPLFQWVLLPGGAGTIAPALHTYFARAGQAGQTTKKPEACLAPVWEARDAGKQGAVLTRYCIPGTLAVAPGPAPACDENAGAGQILAESIACDAANDFAAMLSGHNLSTARITRLVTRVAPKAASAFVSKAGTAGVSPIAAAVGADTTGCSFGTGGSGGGGYGGGGFGGGGNTSGGGYIPEQPEPYDPGYVQDSAHTDVGFFCGGSAESDSSCSGDSSSSSNEDSCSGDSSDSGSDDGACSGDSSDSGSGDACSGDSSSSGTDGGGCSGDTSNGGGCSGDSGGGDCRLSGPRRRPRASIVGMGLAALAFVLRRARRRPGRRRSGRRRRATHP
jgi:hypothetical protein